MKPRLLELLQHDSRCVSSSHNGIIISSRIRLARNVAEQPFRRNLDRSQQEALTHSLMRTCSRVLNDQHFLHLNLDDLSDIQRKALVERFLISPELAASRRSEAVIIANDEHCSAMINEEDHMRLQVLKSGFDLRGALEDAIELDQKLESQINWAYHERFGYLTSCPTNTGTGMRASVMLHLPAMAETKEIRNALRAIGKLHLAVRGLHGEGSEAAGHFYQISNQRTLGLSEDDIIERLELVIKDLIDYEQMARDSLLKSKKVEIEDKVFRAWGCLTNARRLTNHELIEQISWVRLGLACKLLPIRDWRVLDRIFIHTQSAHLELQHRDADNGNARKELRAELVRMWLMSAAI
ncbi:MAG: ATP--guanido phosphotransferase [Planctomycetes bacterium]|nr:ATP--guanido phosphotransferase [Planctomycetota bacterium]